MRWVQEREVEVSEALGMPGFVALRKKYAPDTFVSSQWLPDLTLAGDGAGDDETEYKLH